MVMFIANNIHSSEQRAYAIQVELTIAGDLVSCSHVMYECLWFLYLWYGCYRVLGDISFLSQCFPQRGEGGGAKVFLPCSRSTVQAT